MTEEVNNHYFTSDDENGALLYLEALEHLPADPMPEGLEEAGVWSGEEHPEWLRWLEGSEQAVSLAVEGSKRESIYFPLILYPDGLIWKTSHLSRVRKLGRALCARAGHLAAQGRGSEGLEYLDAAFRVGTALQRGESISLIIGSGIREGVLRTVLEVLEQQTLSRQQLLAFSEKLGEWALTEFPDREAWVLIAKLECASSTEGYLSEHREGGLWDYTVGLWESRAFAEEMSCTSWDYVVKAESLKEVARRIEEASTPRGLPPGASSGRVRLPLGEAYGVILDAMKMPWWKGFTDKLLAQWARMALLRTYTAARLNALDTSSCPQSVEVLVPEYLESLPVDPFTDKPLQFVVRDGALVIYSVGRDREDGGGIGTFYDADPHTSTWGKQDETNVDICLSLN